MEKTSTSHKILTSMSLTLIILNVFSAILAFRVPFLIVSGGIDIMVIFSSVFTILFYILMNCFTFYTLKNIGLIIYNSILFICELIILYARYLAQNNLGSPLDGLVLGIWALVIICANNLVFMIIDIIIFFVRKYSTKKQNSNNDYVADQVYVQNVKYPKDNYLDKEPFANTQDTIPNTQFIEPTNNQPIIQEQNRENHFDEQNVKHIQDENVVENNVTIDLNKLSPEQKDMLLAIILQNNRKY